MARSVNLSSSHRAKLGKRILSAAVLIPFVFCAVWLGGFYWDSVVLVAGMLMLFEWTQISRRDAANLIFSISADGALAIVAFFFALLAVVLVKPGFALAFFCVLISTTFVFFCALPLRGIGAFWPASGVLYIGLPSVAALLIRNAAPLGTVTLAWVLALVIAADTCAYFFGTILGGPKLAPRISPNKTWSGLFGAMLGAGLAGAIVSVLLALNFRHTFVVIALSTLLGLIEQAGDLFESAFKRHFNVKDSGQLIPGHGGVLDRADGLLAVLLTVAFISFYSPEGIFAW